ncbi:hypothetical protein CHH27_18070 [Labrenzia sp. VG12]|nr:hypothetical protein CHH27_18070 [Labrenzia sp. VG12]
MTVSWAVTAPASVAQYMNYAETDCNTEIEEFFLAVFLWTFCANKAVNPQFSAAFSAHHLL